MSESIKKIFEKGGGEFVSPPSVLTRKLKKVRAIILDWDGVFNDGTKRGAEGSIFSEIDAMGVNLLRFTLTQLNSSLPVTAVLTGENNPSAFHLAERENFHAVYFKMKNKGEAFKMICDTYRVRPEECIFFFDDVLDLEVARQCGARIMIGRRASPMLRAFTKKSFLVDYITASTGGSGGLREGIELVMGLLGKYDEVVKNRMILSKEYQAYIASRKKVKPEIVEGGK